MVKKNTELGTEWRLHGLVGKARPGGAPGSLSLSLPLREFSILLKASQGQLGGSRICRWQLPSGSLAVCYGKMMIYDQFAL
jgi:hypothetical protein